jgi:hypothetical protein
MARIDPTKTPRPGCEECIAAGHCREFGWRHIGFIANCSGITVFTADEQEHLRGFWRAERALRENGTPIPAEYRHAKTCKFHYKNRKDDE